MADSTHETVIKVTADTDGLDREMAAGGKAYDRFIGMMKRRGDALKKIKAGPTIDVVDKTPGKINQINSRIKAMTSRVHKITLQAVDKVSSVISRATSPLAILGAGVGVYGIGKLTLGAAMDFETQEVSMLHWLKDDVEKKNDVINWLEKFAADTPFEMKDLFPAMARAVGISEGNVNMAKRLEKLSADMTGLTPGKKITDAMEAIADAQMGEFERMKEFGMKFSKDQMDAAGGFIGFLTQAEQKFAGGAEKLSKTVSGRLSTVMDTIATTFRRAGQGMLEALSPELEKLTNWLGNGAAKAKEVERGFVGWAIMENPIIETNKALKEGVVGWQKMADKTVYTENRLEKFQNKLKVFGREGVSYVIDKIESMINWIDELNKNDKFQNLSFGGKIMFAFDDMMKQFKSWLDSGGQDQLNKIGATMGDIIASGLEAAAPRIAQTAVIIGEAIGRAVISGLTKVFEIGNPSENSVLDRVRKSRQETGDSPTKPGGVFGNILEQFTLNFGKKANGGIVAQPQLSLIGEAGPEVIIPLSSRMKSRAMDLWQQTGRHLGVGQYELGGFAGSVPASAHAGPVGNGINIYVGDTRVSISDSSELDEDALALRIGRKIVYNVKKALENRT